ncbi:MAG: lipid-A-disaccharide synthase, partial [Pseudomonadota bacterium]
MTRRLYFVAGEPSGDLIGREVMDAIRARTPNLLYRSTGGTFMAECAPSSGLDTRPLAVLGFWEGIKAYRDVVRLADKT